MVRLMLLSRIIPACAGQTRCSARPCSCRPDHPRLCGANTHSWRPSWPTTGSSPLVRGKRDYRDCRSCCLRIIPACAGQTEITQQHHAPYRIIPACAGQTQGFLELERSPSDHPRLCGANGVLVELVVSAAGSSPLVRGKLCRYYSCEDSSRIIPACAGQTFHGGGEYGQSADHPRLCGANSSRHYGSTRDAGSSPLVRGKRATANPSEAARRIIPACAGQTVRLYWQNTLSTMSENWICTVRSPSVVAIRRTITDRIVDTATHCSIPCAVRAKVF